MLVLGTIREEVNSDAKSVIVEFEGDPKKQHFEIHCTFKPIELDIQKSDVYQFKIRWESEIFVDPKNGRKSYFTHLFCDKAIPFRTIRIEEKDLLHQNKNTQDMD